VNWYKQSQLEEEYFSQGKAEKNIYPEDNFSLETQNNYQPTTVGREVLYHGGRRKFDINVHEIPSNGLFLSNQREVAVVNVMPAGRYWKMKSLGADVSRIAEDKIAEFYVDLKRPLIVDANGRDWLNVPIPQGMREQVFETMDSVDTDNIGELAKENNYDGAIIKNVVEGKGASIKGDTYIVFDKSSLIPVRG
jgi:hypothetical protein